MLANIRVRENGTSRKLCTLDILKFSERQVLERMEERGITEDTFFICGIEDWQVDTSMSLYEVYALKRQVETFYNGDDYLVRFLLQAHWSVSNVLSIYHRFKTKDELELMEYLLDSADPKDIVRHFYRYKDWVSAIQAFVDAGYVISTPKGFYVDLNR